jgi:hypothetical protein
MDCMPHGAHEWPLACDFKGSWITAVSGLQIFLWFGQGVLSTDLFSNHHYHPTFNEVALC